MERWERELERLRGLRLSGRARARVDDGPKGDGMPPAPARGQRVLAGVVAFAVFGGAVALASGMFDRDPAPPLEPPAPSEVVLTLTAGATDPEASLTYGDEAAAVATSAYCWTQENGAEKCIDVAALPVFTDTQFLQVPAGTPLVVSNEDGATPVTFVVAKGADPASCALPIGRELASADAFGSLAPGRYVLQVVARWPDRASEGIAFHFPVELTAPPTEEVLVASLDAPDDGTIPGLTLTYGDTSTTFFAQGGEWPGTGGFDEPLQLFAPTVAPGEDLRIEGDARDEIAWLTVADAPALEGDGLVDLTDGQGNLPMEPGVYLLEITGAWERGTATFTVQIEIGVATPSGSTTSEPPAPAPLVATLDAPDDGTMPGLTLSYMREGQDYIAQGGEWPGVNGFVMPLFSFPGSLPRGTPLVIEGDADEVEAWVEIVRSDGRPTGETIPVELVDRVGTLPDVEGPYELQISGTWSRGTAAFFVRIQIREPEPAPSPSPLPVAEPGVVPDVIGIGEGDAYKVLSNAELDGSSVYEPTPDVTAGLVIFTDPPPGTELAAGSTVTLLVSGTSVALDGYLSNLACAQEDMMPFEAAGSDLPAGESRIRVNVVGIQASDELRRVSEDDPAGIGLWEVIREGDVVAVVDYETLQGIACRGSEIEGV